MTKKQSAKKPAIKQAGRASKPARKQAHTKRQNMFLKFVHSRLSVWLFSIVVLGIVGLTLFYHPSQNRDAASSKQPQETLSFAENLDYHISNYLQMDYWERKDDYAQAQRFYGRVSQWLEESDISGRAFLGYLYVGDYARASTFLGTLENSSLDKVAPRYHGLNLEWLGNQYGFGGEHYADWEHLFVSLQAIKAGDISKARDHLKEMKSAAIVFRYTVPMIQFFTQDKKQVQYAPLAKGETLSADKILYASMQISHAAMQQDWEQIALQFAGLERYFPLLSFDIQLACVHALYHLGRSEEIFTLLDSLAQPYDMQYVIWQDVRDAVMAENLPPLRQDLDYHLAMRMLEIIHLLNRSKINPRDSVILARLALYLAPEQAALHSGLAETLVTHEKTEEAIALREALQRGYDREDFPLRIMMNNELILAQLYASQIVDKGGDDVKRSITLLRGLQKRYPEIYLLYMYEGRIWRGVENYKAALKAYNKAFATLPFSDYRDYQPQFSDLQEILANEGKPASSLQAEIQALRPFWSLFYYRGIVHERLKKLDKAEQDMLFAAVLNPRDANLLNYLGYIWADRGINIEQAIILIKRAIQLEKHNGDIIDSLAWAYYRKGDYAQARRVQEQAVQLSPDNAVITDHLGDIYWQMGLKRDAQFQWQRSLDLDPEPEQIKLIKNKLKHGIKP